MTARLHTSIEFDQEDDTEYSAPSHILHVVCCRPICSWYCISNVIQSVKSTHDSGPHHHCIFYSNNGNRLKLDLVFIIKNTFFICVMILSNAYKGRCTDLAEARTSRAPHLLSPATADRSLRPSYIEI